MIQQIIYTFLYLVLCQKIKRIMFTRMMVSKLKKLTQTATIDFLKHMYIALHNDKNTAAHLFD